MTRHPATEGNDLSPNRVDAQEDVTVLDNNGNRVSLAEFSEDAQDIAREQAIKFAVAL